MQHWITLTAACYLNHNYEGCVSAADSILKFSEGMKQGACSEIVLLALRAYIALKKYTEALVFLGKYKKLIVD